MSTIKPFIFVYLTILSSYIGYVYASPCSRVPQGTSAGKVTPTGNFGLRISSNSGFYQPGRQYTIFLERKNLLWSRESGGKPKFNGFFLAIERSSTTPSEYAEEFSPAIHGKLLIDEAYQSLVRLSCGNVATHYLDTPKSEIQVNWTAPEAGAGNLSIRATVIENRDNWYKDGIFLTLDLQEDVDPEADYYSNVLTECSACDEAKYELSFEGLWSKHTHPKNFPSNQYEAKFGDIIGATHKVGKHFWTSGDKASDGFQYFTIRGETDMLELELKNMTSDIRTIIKARGLSHPNITTKTLAVFRVDNENHLVSFVSAIIPSPDWFVGISALELCQPEGQWVESKVLDLYPWDAGTNDGITYTDKRPMINIGNDRRDFDRREYDRREYIRRITSDWPASQDSPFYDENGTKMKPLARLTLSRQRLYRKPCPDDETENEAVFDDADCDEAVSYSSWGPCQPFCKKSADQRGTQTRNVRFKSTEAKQMCEQRYYEKERECEIQSFCVGQNQDEQENVTPPPQQTDDGDQYQYQTTTPPPECEGTYRKVAESMCMGTCGNGIKNRTLHSRLPNCEDKIEEITCVLAPCRNEDFCIEMLDAETCNKDPTNPTSPTNMIYYDASSCTCMVFTTYCVKEERKNIFETFKECTTACQLGEDFCKRRLSPRRRN